ncbi:MAG: GTP 3',8-cyclase MoaA [Acidimicrobiia bacterium]|nr:GTP 3',8-cyclase MoaA [Acidimicrobiia bacterium]
MDSPYPPLIDGFGRVADDLRISVTDRCNLRCTYCMPAAGLPWLPRTDILTFEEIARVAGLLVGAGVKTIRLTGGEPLVRRDLVHLVEMLAALAPRPDLALTTNGVLLAEAAASLAAAGLDRVNVSLDSLRRERYEKITRRDELDRTLAGMEAAAAAGLTPVKVNMVVMRGTNDDELVDFARFARDEGYVVRFIEYMPLDADGRWTSDDVVAAEEMLETLAAAGVETEGFADESPEPATRYSIEGREKGTQAGEIGVIPSVTAPFCDRCNRIRLTAEGGFRTCLFALEEVDVRGPLRAGAGDDEILALLRKAVAGKWAGHKIGSPDFQRPRKSMSQIGG